MFFLVAACVVTLDITTKAAVHQLHGDIITLVPGWFMIGSYMNRGLLFGLVPLAPAVVQNSLVSVGLVLVLIYRLRCRELKRSLDMGLAAMLGGGIANLWDRMADGWVTDFIHVKPLPVTNIADWAIVLGLAITVWQSSKEPHIASHSD
ncbi:MAG: signal peptidase II [Acidobacteria bacterium]|nr:signal peptidase II [Acidobacteriota bacterium]